MKAIIATLIILLGIKASGLLLKVKDETKYALYTPVSSKIVSSAYKQSTEKDKSKEDSNTEATKIMNHSEVQVYKSLSKRRQQINQLENNLALKETLLKTTTTNIENKIQELKTLQIKVEEVLKKYEEKTGEDIQKLVRIYENMKPKEAAQIWNGLEMKLLFQIINKMKEVRVAPILAHMSPSKATEISTEFARYNGKIRE